jgi:hypothetical protein
MVDRIFKSTFQRHLRGLAYRSDEDYVFAHPTRGSKLEAKRYHDPVQTRRNPHR